MASEQRGDEGKQRESGEKDEVKARGNRTREDVEKRKGYRKQYEEKAEEKGEKGTVKGGWEGSDAQKEESERPSVEEISYYRQIAQQNSMEAIRAAEERYSKANELASAAMAGRKESASHGKGAAAAHRGQLGSQAEGNLGVQGETRGEGTAMEEGKGERDCENIREATVAAPAEGAKEQETLFEIAHTVKELVAGRDRTGGE
ncbi:hypothetical protein Nepgr_009130 [Nepenthes gracilis]|uniref:Uncharacterized protein n=1 Tax=Nepenthes gracilis TaxID=150966 RepID=A0AAD3XK32_NEPGR|nr:hypothetical protein Nepgr_009130 [Nepenthes gracilis]